MSFISKLFRKTDAAETPEDEPAPVAPSSDADAAAQPEQQTDAGIQAGEARAGDDAGETTPEAGEPEERTDTSASRAQPADNAWWEESAPPQEWTTPPIVDTEPTPAPAPSTVQAANGTQPLRPEAANGTQPLRP